MPKEENPNTTAQGKSSGPHPPLPVSALVRHADLSGLAFTTTADLTPLDGETTQPRALEAVTFATGIARPGYNLFVIGPRETRMRDVVQRILSGHLKDLKPPSDWV